MNKFRWIDESIEIDFELPKSMQNLIEKMEELDLQENYAYFSYSEALDTGAKLLYAAGKLTQHQWDLLCAKYDA